jgi:hypothetical protein
MTMNKDEARKTIESLNAVGSPVDRGVRPHAEQCADLERRLRLAMRQWDTWKAYALELQSRLVKYEGGSPMVLNDERMAGWLCSKCGTDRTKAACPKGHTAALTGECPMVGTAA